MNIIDVGCGKDGRSFGKYVPEDWHITGIDVVPSEYVQHEHPHFTYVNRDAQDLSCFGNNEFDLAVSIGMLEHISGEIAFRKVISEIRRVAKQHIVVVPYRYCWIEPHFGVPFFPLFPYSVKVALVKAFNLNGERMILKRDPDFIKKHYRWLSNTEYRVEFPDSRTYVLPTRETVAIIRSCQI
jgi:ubiquinone/menaquinone biosynthesis C-methylase UbiE